MQTFGAIQGIDAAFGTVQGREKAVRELCEASKVRPGNNLVCEMTMPDWTHCSR